MKNFSQIRSMLQGGLDTSKLIDLLVESHEESSEAYFDKVYPYVNSFSSKLSETKSVTVNSFERLQQVHDLVPGVQLRFKARISQDFEDILSASKIYERVREIITYHQYAFISTVQKLSQCTAFPNVQKLDLQGLQEEVNFAPFFERHHFYKLKVLNLELVELSNVDFKALAHSTCFPELTHLNLNCTTMTGETLKEFSESTTFTSVTHLDIGFNSLFREDFQYISKAFPNLLHLNYQYTSTGFIQEASDTGFVGWDTKIP